MSFVRAYVGFANGTLLFLTFAIVGVTFNLALDAVMRRFVSDDVRHRAGPTAAVTVQVLATIYAVLVAFVIVNEYSQLRSANEQVAVKAADLSAMNENSRIFPTAEGDPYYPVPKGENYVLYRQYEELAKRTENVHFVGRLATYKYYNMDQVVAQALTLFRKLQPQGGEAERAA